MLSRRLLSGLCIAVVVISGILWGPWPVLLAAYLALGLATQAEFLMLMVPDQDRCSRRFTLASGGAVLLAAFFETSGSPTFIAPTSPLLILSLLGLLLLGMRQGTWANAVPRLAAAMLSMVYIALCFGFVARLGWGDWRGADAVSWPSLTRHGRLMILYAVWVVKLSDVGAYAFGMSLGRRKLCPGISPAKTWEGFWGGILAGLGASCLAMVLLTRTVPDWPIGMVDALALGLLLPVMGVAGDLCESVFKRGRGVKDSGRWIPGMGGVLDVLDSLLFTIPAMVVYLGMRLS